MKRNLTVVCVLIGILAAAFFAASVVGFVYSILPVGIICAVMGLVAVWALAGSIYREWMRERFVARYRVRDYLGAKAVLDRASRNHFLYPFLRIALNQLYLRIELCLDDIPAAVRYTESLRRLGGDGWKYKTAYFVTLFNLDWKDIAAARTEYENFRAACEHAEIYREELEVLRGIFDHIDGHGGELPDLVKKADYPILHRVVQTYC